MIPLADGFAERKAKEQNECISFGNFKNTYLKLPERKSIYLKQKFM